MINFNYEHNFKLFDEKATAEWISSVIVCEGFKEDEINYIFCDDTYLHKLNLQFLNHDTLTDVIGFDYTVGKILQGDIFISTERVQENAKELSVDFIDELHRVIVHGLLHFCGYKDKSKEDENLMRRKEDHYLSIR